MNTRNRRAEQEAQAPEPGPGENRRHALPLTESPRGALLLLLLLAVTLLLQPWNEARAQNVTLPLARPYGVSARASALAGADAASTYDVSSLYRNPAGLLFMEHFGLFADHQQDIRNVIWNEELAFPVYLSRRDAFAVGATAYHIGTFQASPITNSRISQYSGTIGYATALVPTLSLGAAVNAHYGRLTTGNPLWAFSSTIGMIYNPSDEISYGLLLEGVGSGLTFVEAPRTRPLLLREKNPLLLEVGAAMHFPSAPRARILSIYVGNEKDFRADVLRYKGGLEVWATSYLALRGGYIVQPDSNAARLGFGLRMGQVRLDYANAPLRASGQFHQISLAVEW